MPTTTRRNLSRWAALALSIVICAPTTNAVANDDAVEWQSIKGDIFGDRKVVEDLNFIDVTAPVQADDGALVPVTMSIPTHVAKQAKSVTLVIDQNPAPVAAKFIFGEAAGLAERRITTRVRLEKYSNVRAVVEMADGNLYMNTKFVKAAGGCAAPNAKDLDKSMAQYGKIKLRWVDQAITAAKYTKPEYQSFPMSEAQVMIKHPNYSGMQRNPETGEFIPAKIIENFVVSKGDRMIFKMEGGISLSENPNFRFTYEAGGTEPIIVNALDTDGEKFEMKAIREGS
ncbi:MAG: quinoprotein dehydrogenase-associated SoxYZ-like carrier [Hyphomicrobiaceae bacterium]